MKTVKTDKGTELPLLDLRGKDYLQVAYRLVWFREEHKDWSIKTKVDINFEKTRCVGSAEILDASGRVIASAHKVEDAKGFADYVEKAETGAIGRALALCGYGTQFTDDLEEGQRLADSPIQRSAAKPAYTPHVRHPSQPQLTRMFAIAGACKVPEEALRHYCKVKFGIESSKELTLEQYDHVVNAIEAGEVIPEPGYSG
jgi:hypothetical protein